MTGDDRREVAREARGAGLRNSSAPSLEAVEHRRSQLWTMAFVVMSGLALGMVLLSTAAAELAKRFQLTDLTAFRVGLIALTLGVAAYVVEKELHLRRLTRRLFDERVLNVALSDRVNELAALSTVAKAVNSVLTLDEVLDIILAGALDLLDGHGGSVLLTEEGAGLRAVCVKGDLGPQSALVPEQVMSHRRPVLAAGGGNAASAMGVPLLNRDEQLGALYVEAAAGRDFGEYDLRALDLFAEHAAVAIANARLYELERAQVAELLEVDRHKSEFVATVSHELRTPLTSILGSVMTLQRPDFPTDQVGQFLAVIERQGRRLLRLIEELLVAQRAQLGLDLRLQAVDVSQAVAEVAGIMATAGRRVTVDALPGVMAMADPQALDQVLFNLVENAFTHGGEPVDVAVEGPDDDRPAAVRVSVRDRGPGVPAGQAEQIFARFARGPEAGDPGMGLGLFLVRTLVEAQGGQVTVEERPGGGAVFSVALPASRARDDMPPSREELTEVSVP